MFISLNNRIISIQCLIIIQLIFLTSAREIKFSSQNVKTDSINEKFDEADQPLILTPLIKSGNVTQARNKAKVSHPEFKGVDSYSGYFTVNESCNSNLFFWYFPADIDPQNAPVVLWLQGGPGSSSLFAAMFENGPLRLTENVTIRKTNDSWSQYYNMLYIDSPVEAGYSFTGRKDCLPTEQTQIGNDLHTALVQFFQLFPDLQKNGFYITGESYAGKYVPVVGYTIHMKNPTAELKINLKGIAIGNGLIDPYTQHRYGQYLYEIGLVDEDGKQELQEVEEKLVKAIDDKDWELASKYDHQLVFGEQESLYFQLTGLTSYYNYVWGDAFDMSVVQIYFNRPGIKKVMHTGNVDFVVSSPDVSKSMRLDFGKGVTPQLAELLNNGYEVLLYNGQLDVCVAYPLTQDLVNRLDFKGKSEFQAASRDIWRVDNEVAGYIQKGGHLTFALVRNAGHMVPTDQPKWMLDLLLRFTKT